MTELNISHVVNCHAGFGNDKEIKKVLKRQEITIDIFFFTYLALGFSAKSKVSHSFMPRTIGHFRLPNTRPFKTKLSATP